MTDKRAELADNVPVEDIDGAPTFVADEDVFDRRRLLWRLTSWGVATIGAVTIAILANQSSVTLQRDQAATTELARQTQQVKALARQNHTEANRLASAIEGLNGDRDRLDARVATLEQGLDSLTGSIAGQVKEQKLKDTPAMPRAHALTASSTTASTLPHHAPASALPAVQLETPSPPAIAAPASSVAEPPHTTIAAPSDSPSPVAAPSAKMSDAPDATAPAATPGIKVMASAQPTTAEAEPTTSAAPSIPVQRTEFGIDLGSANSIDGLRALWRGVLHAHSKEVGSLEPIIVIREHTNGLGMRLHLVAGPLSDAADAAKICAALTDRKRTCETSVYDGQRLALRESSHSAVEAAIAKPKAAQRAVSHHKRNSRLTRIEQPVPLPVPPPPPEPAPSKLGSFFSH